MKHTDWLAEQVRRPLAAAQREQMLERVRLGSRAGGALAGVRVLVGREPCWMCLQLADHVYDADFAPTLPVRTCTRPLGCRCTYTPVMLYELDDWLPDSRPKPVEYAAPILHRLTLALRARGAVGGVRLLASTDSCSACRQLTGRVYDPAHAPRIPVATCTRGQCRCAYVPALAYEPR